MSESEDSRAPWLLAAAAVVLVAAAVGGFFVFGPGDARVSGALRLDNAPLAGAQVIFVAEDGKNPVTVATQTDGDGRYVLVGNQGKGVPLGKYKVVVSKMTLKDGTVPAGEKLEQARMNDLLVNVLPPMYEDIATTPFLFDLRGGATTVNLELRKKP